MIAGQETIAARRLLRFDAIGATLTAGLTLGVLASGVIETGLPVAILLVLGGAAALIAMFSWHASLRGAPAGPKLRRLARINLAYATATIAACMAHRDSVSVSGWVYFPVEAILLLLLAAMESRSARRLEP